MTWGQGKEMTLTFNAHLPSSTLLNVCLYQLSGHRLLYILKNSLFSLFPIEKSKLIPNLTCRKIGQGQPRVIIWTNYDGLESHMLHTKFCENRCSKEEDFWRVYTIYGCGGHLGHVTRMPQTNFHSPYPRRLHIKFGFDWPSGFGEEDVWKCEQTPDAGAWVYDKLTYEPLAQVSS